MNSKDIEEVKPGIYVKKNRKGDYIHVEPIVLDGKFKFWAFLRRWFYFVILLLLVFAYIHDTTELREFHDNFWEDPRTFCEARIAESSSEYIIPCTDDELVNGLCLKTGLG